MSRWRALLLFVAYIGTVWAANWAIGRFGVVPVGFGLMAPAGVYFAGLAFTLRDLLHESAGSRRVIVAILIGAALSAFLENGERIALASAVAFLLSESLDMVVYSPLRHRRWLLAVVLSNIVGLVVDSVVFLWLAFGSLAFLPGQLVGKALTTLGAVVLLAAWRNRALLSRHPSF